MPMSITTAILDGIHAVTVPVTMAVVPSPRSQPPLRTREATVRVRAALHGWVDATLAVTPESDAALSLAADLALAVSALVAAGVVDPTAVARVAFWGELGFDGTVRAVRGTLAAVEAAAAARIPCIVIPAACADEVADLVPDIVVYTATHIAEVIGAFTGDGAAALSPARARAPQPTTSDFDLADVRGLSGPRWALEVAAAGGHNLALVGPPGIGKSMLARRLPSILPPLTRSEMIDVTRIYSTVGLGARVAARPFRSPHHSVSAAALLGGGSTARPGEATLAHHGVLFLDELSEFQRSTTESLYRLFETREVVTARAHATLRLPADFLFVAATNPCPCGWAGSAFRECACDAAAIARYRGRLAPLRDHVDLYVDVPPVVLAELRNAAPGESSAVVRERVIAARAAQTRRQPVLNARLSDAEIRALCPDVAVSARTLRVARTIADLRGGADVTADDVERAACCGWTGGVS